MISIFGLFDESIASLAAKSHVFPLDPSRPTGTLAQPAPVAPKEALHSMTLNFKNIPHALATFFKAAVAEAKKAEVGIEKIESEKAVIEGVSSAIATGIAPGSAGAVITIEDAGFALLGAVDAALKSGNAAAEQKLLNAGLDQQAIDAVKAVGVQSKAIYTLVKAKTA